MFAAPFEYYRPKSVNEAVKMLKKVKGARVLAGGHSLIPAMKLRLATPAALIDISRIEELARIRGKKGELRIGALATHAAVAESEDVRRMCPVLAATAAQIGDLQVRNRGTIGGSVAHADPGADYPTVLLMLEATFKTRNGKEREIPAHKFFVDLFTTALKSNELLTEVSVEPYDGAAVYLKHRHPASSFAVVGVAAMASVKGGKFSEVRVSIGGVTASPVRAAAVEKALKGQPVSAIATAAELVTGALDDPLSDSYASGDFRIHLATVMTKRALTEVASKAR